MVMWEIIKTNGVLSNGIRYYDAHWIKYDEPQLCDCGRKSRLFVEMRGTSETDWFEFCTGCAEAEGIIKKVE